MISLTLKNKINNYLEYSKKYNFLNLIFDKL